MAVEYTPTNRDLLAASALSRRIRRRYERRDKAASGSEGQPDTRNRRVPGYMNKVRADSRREATENGGREAVGKGKTRSPHADRHDLGEKNDHSTVIAAIDE